MPQPRKNPSPQDVSNDVGQIGSRIKLFRVKRGFSQARPAEKVGLSREAIAAYCSPPVTLAAFFHNLPE